MIRLIMTNRPVLRPVCTRSTVDMKKLDKFKDAPSLRCLTWTMVVNLPSYFGHNARKTALKKQHTVFEAFFSAEKHHKKKKVCVKEALG